MRQNVNHAFLYMVMHTVKYILGKISRLVRKSVLYKNEGMKEKVLTNRDEYGSSEPSVSVEFGGFRGEASMRSVGSTAMRWQINIQSAETNQVISHWDGPEINGEGLVVPSLRDIEQAQHEINIAIEQYIWDPMSQS